MTSIAVVLSGCGHRDGAEIRESVLTLLYLDQLGSRVEIFAPDVAQAAVVNHATGETEGESRNVMVEAARIARGEVKPLSSLKAEAFDALVLPGGFGAAKNLSDFAQKGKDCSVLPDLQRAIRDFHAQKKPIGAICIAPALLTAALRGVCTPVVTIGEDAGTATAIEAMGGKHKQCLSRECVVDHENLLVTCSAYMRSDRLSSIAEGIEKTIHEVVSLAKAAQKKAA